MTPSQYQLDFYNWIRKGSGNALIRARAGSGKTTTILEGLKYISPNLTTLSLAFNKSIAEELKQRVPNYVDAMTVHSLGAKALYRYFDGKIKITKWKNLILFDALIKRDALQIPSKGKMSYKKLVCDLVSLYRLNNCYEYSELADIAAYHGIDILNGELDHAYKLIEYIDHYNEEPCSSHEKNQKLIDFNDMIYMPVRNRNIRLRKYDWVFVDEAQDLSVLHQHFIRKLIKPSTRCVFVGDDFQSIYGFAGADANSFDNLRTWPNMTELPLSVCYRCGKNIVKHAQQIYQDIEFHNDQIEGTVRFGTWQEADYGDFILCRNNRPLVELYFELLKDGKRCYIKGKDIGEGILRIVNKVMDKTVEQAREWFTDQKTKTIEKLVKDGVANPHYHPKYYNLKEKIDIINIVLDNYDTVEEAYNQIEHMFSDNGSGITLSSIHKSKGLEADRVFILMRELIPSKYSTQPWQKKQENNLLYVMITRAKQELIYITNFTQVQI